MVAHPHPASAGPLQPFTVAGLLTIVIGLIVIGAVLYLINLLPISEPYKKIINILVLLVVVIAVIVWVARFFGVLI